MKLFPELFTIIQDPVLEEVADIILKDNQTSVESRMLVNVRVHHAFLSHTRSRSGNTQASSYNYFSSSLILYVGP
jgi:hypothetical protein